MEVLSERERRVISLQFGFDPQAKPMTLQEIATIHGVCKERIRQIQTRAIEKLHKVVAGKPYLREIVDT